MRRLPIASLLLVAVAACTPAPVEPAPDQQTSSTPMVTPAPAKSPTRAQNPKLRAELLAMLAADQKARAGDGQGGVAEDRQRTGRLEQIIKRYGWPTRTLVAVDGATAAWAIAQHSDLDLDFQRRALALMQAAAEQGEADRGELAYLTDRVAANAGEPQTYGTQMGCADGSPRPADLVDPERVDERRAAAGLPPLADYLKEMAAICAQTG